MQPKPTTQFVLLARDQQALAYAKPIFASTPDPLELMNQLTRWPDPPAIDDQWIKKLAAACEIAAAYAKLAHNYRLEAERNRYTCPR